jgi:ribosome recycling factor
MEGIMLNSIKQTTEQKMKKALENLVAEFAKIRTGRAHPSLLDHVMVESYGNTTPLSQVASVSVSDPRTLMVSPWDKTLVAAVEKAIQNADLGLNPATAGTAIRVPMPALTEDRRKSLIKVVKAEAENARVSVRNVRRDANNKLKELLKEKTISEDEEHRGQDLIQKLTDQTIAQIEKLVGEKETDLLHV